MPKGGASDATVRDSGFNSAAKETCTSRCVSSLSKLKFSLSERPAREQDRVESLSFRNMAQLKHFVVLRNTGVARYPAGFRQKMIHMEQSISFALYSFGRSENRVHGTGGKATLLNS